jgi:hypothetical protein
MMNLKKILTVITFVLSFYTCSAQPENNNWYFAKHIALNFSTGTPVNMLTSAMWAFEGSASISDSLGNLLFYSDGIKVWDKNNNLMPNGFELNGAYSSTQSTIIVKKPLSNHLYYIFTTDDIYDSIGFCYSIIDMNLNNGLGDIVVKNILVRNNISEKLTGIRHCNGIDFWILVHDKITNSFYNYKLTSNGLSASPIQTDLGCKYKYHNYIPSGISGYLKASPDGKMIAATAGDTLQLFDFNNANGIISNLINIPFIAPEPIESRLYGVSFSPNSKYLYVTCPGMPGVFQFDVSSKVQSTIIASKYITPSPSGGAAMALAPDNKIYITYDFAFLSVIHFPDQPAAACGFELEAFIYPSGNNYVGSYGLPNFIDAIHTAPNNNAVTPNLPQISQVCSLPLTLDAGSFRDSYLWSTGDTSQSITINSPGLYWVTQTGNYCNEYDHTDSTFVEIFPKLNFTLGNDTTLCFGKQLELKGPDANSFLWNSGNTSQSIEVWQSGIYNLQVNDINNCIANDEIEVTFFNESGKLLPNDTTIRDGELLFINAENGYENYTWSNGTKEQGILIFKEGKYYLSASNKEGCLIKDSIFVKMVKPIFPGVIKVGEHLVIHNLPKECNLEIYNNIGQLIFSTENYKNDFTPMIAREIYLAHLKTRTNNYFGKLLIMD